MRLRVEDDGKGFDPSTVPDGHLGLAGMRARAERVGATFACHRARRAGARRSRSIVTARHSQRCDAAAAAMRTGAAPERSLHPRRMT